jgi:hypothetical protein
MRKLLFLTLLIFTVGCSPSVDTALLSGYWNIEKVVLPDGSEKEFPFSNHMDHFEVCNYQGIKYRVSPTYDGGFVNYGSPVNFTIRERNDEIHLHFRSGEESYQQKLVLCTSERLVLLHENGTTYHYSSFKTNHEEQ